MRWSVGVRLLIAPIITFGPIMGIAIAGTSALLLGCWLACVGPPLQEP